MMRRGPVRPFAVESTAADLTSCERLSSRALRLRANSCRLAIGLVLLGSLLTGFLPSALSAPPDPARPLRVVTTPSAPFVLPETDPLAGFSIDLWNEVARRMEADFRWKIVPYADLLPSVERGEADVAISAITMTPTRDKTVDFSHPYFDTGLQIMVRAQGTGRLTDAIRSIPWRSAVELFAFALIILFLLANVVWLVERRRNPRYQRGYLRALGEGMWGSTMIISTGEYGDSEAASISKRVVVGTMWLLGVVLVALFTASVTSSQTIARLRSDIRGPEDLPGKTIGTVPGSIAADYLTKLGLPFVPVTNADEGFRLLSRGGVQAIVFDSPTLKYWVARRGDAGFLVVGPIFRPEKYGIVVAEGSPLRKRINEALLRIFEDGTYEQIYRKWFAHGG